MTEEKPKVQGLTPEEFAQKLSGTRKRPFASLTRRHQGIQGKFWGNHTLEEKREEAKRNRPPVPSKRKLTKEQENLALVKSYIGITVHDRLKLLPKLQELSLQDLLEIQKTLLTDKTLINTCTVEKYNLALNIINALVQQKSQPEKETIGSKIQKYLHL